MFKFFKKNNSGNQKVIIIALFGVALILVILVTIDLTKRSVKTSLENTSAETKIEGTSNTPVTPAAAPAGAGAENDKFQAEVPANIVVPDTNTKLTETQKKEIALPTVVVPAAPGVSSQFRNFEIKAEGGAFVPTKVIAHVGDTVQINFTAVDGNYDIVFPSYNMSQTASKGETKILGFQAVKEGSFTYYCSSCGGPDKGPKGNIIIAK